MSKGNVKTLSTQVTHLSDENKSMKATLLDLQCHSMRDNLIFSGIPEQNPDKPEEVLKEFMETSLKLSKETVEQITFNLCYYMFNNFMYCVFVSA